MTSPGVAVVTGAGRGMGAATVRSLAAAGWTVVGLDAPPVGSLAGYPLATPAELAAVAGDRVHVVEGDVRSASDVAAAVSLASSLGQVRAAVAVAGLMAGGQPVWETPASDVEDLWQVNVLGVLNLARAAVPAMLAAPAPRWGRFVAVASAAAHRGLLHLAAYGASKHACVGLVRGMAADLRGTGITANCVSPGSTDTDMLARSASFYDLPSAESFAQQALLERLLSPDEQAAAITWLCSEAASGVTGTVLRVDGGLTT